MARPLIATKFYVPRLRPGLVARPRLLARLRLGADARLTLVSAPAGFGKTTLLVEWLGVPPTDGGVAWLSLDAADNEPALFWTYVVMALQRVVPDVGSSALELLVSSPATAELALTTLLNDLAAEPRTVWLVLDDYHLVDNPVIGESVAFLLERLPATVHVVISTRADPDLLLSRWRARGELVEIRAGELRFTPDEAAAYLNGAAGLDLNSDDVAVLEERTEGWIAALQLAVLSLRGRDDVSGFIARFAGDDRYVVDYLVEEVLRHQTDTVRDFLSQTAVLARLTGPLCDAVTGRDDGGVMLEALERANLFLVALDDQRVWYRYHHLFADVLTARLLAEQPSRVALLHDRASRWYEDQGLVEEAIRHALAALDFDRAAHLMELAVPLIRRNRQDGMLLGWLRALPDETVRRSPVLSVFYGYLLMVAGDLDAAELRLDEAERQLLSVPAGDAALWADTEELRTLPSTMAVYRASIAQAHGDAAGTAEHAQRALDLAGPADHLSLGAAAGLLGLAAWANGDVSGALHTFAQAVASLHAAGNLVDELSSTVILADLWPAAGRPGKARRLYDGALQVRDAHGQRLARAVADLHVGLCEIDLEVGDVECARVHLQTAAALGIHTVPTESRYRWFVAAARLACVGGDPDEAVSLLGQAEQLYNPGFFPDVRPIPALRARIWITQGNLAAAADWARERGVSATDEARYLREFDHLTLVRLLLAQHREQPDTGAAEQAGELLDRLHSAADTSGRVGSLLEIRMLQALVHDASGHRARALKSLAEAFALAPEPDSYLRLFLNEGDQMTGLLRGLRQAGAASPSTRRLLGRIAARDVTTGAGLTAVPVLPDPLSARELQVLRLLDSELSGPEIARELFVSHNTLRSHTKHIFLKLDVTSRRAAVRLARDRGLM